MSNSNSATIAGISMGGALAMIISYGINHSIGWAIWHGILSWIYVIYRWIVGC
jgi:hypothetical protein